MVLLHIQQIRVDAVTGMWECVCCRPLDLAPPPPAAADRRRFWAAPSSETASEAPTAAFSCVTSAPVAISGGTFTPTRAHTSTHGDERWDAVHRGEDTAPFGWAGGGSGATDSCGAMGLKILGMEAGSPLLLRFLAISV